jgi:predicted PurR-regulated permease PerM
VEGERSLQVTITVKTLLLAVALVFFTWALVSVRDMLLVVAVGVFLGLVFERPVQLVQRKTNMSRESARR